MKVFLLTLVFVFGFSQFSFSQLLISCGIETVNSFINTEISYLSPENCSDDFLITVDETNLDFNENIELEGILEVNRAKSIVISGSQNHSIIIKPYEEENATGKKVVFYQRKKLPEGRATRIKTTNRDSKNLDSLLETPLIILYPNPVTTTLTIQTEEIVLSYSIINTQGYEFSKGNLPANNVINVSQLPVGLFVIRLQTISGIATKTFNKN